MSGLMVNQFMIILFNFGSGIFINNNSTNVIVKFLTWISPFRYASEALMRCFLKDKANIDMIYTQFNYTLGADKCIYVCLGFMVAFFLMSWIAVEYKSMKLFKK